MTAGIFTFGHAEHDVLRRTVSGSPLGDALRQYWVPALLSSELVAGGAPVRVKLMGESLVAFRDDAGTVGLLDEFCNHRGASLFYGRNADGALQCVYHGWSFDTSGINIENPTCPALAGDPRLAQTSYPVMEEGGLVFAYLGDPASTPPLPDMGWLRVADDARFVAKRHHPCHWLQALEADIDSAHVPFLHREDIVRNRENRGAAAMLAHTDPTFDVDPAPSGLQIAAHRDLDDGMVYTRINHWLAPWYTVVPADNPEGLLGIHAWVPIDDESCWIFGLMWNVQAPLTAQQRTNFSAGHGGIFCELVPDGSFRARRHQGNDYEIDREAQRSGQIWTGVTGNQEQDDVITASMGPAYDRSREHLVDTDAGVIATRKALLAIADDHAAGIPLLGRAGRGYDVPSIFLEAAAGADWRADAVALMPSKQVTPAHVERTSA